jgi:DNA-binding LytR/AlgR family response regulator
VVDVLSNMMKIKKRTAIEALTAAVDLATAAEAAQAEAATTLTEAVKKAATEAVKKQQQHQKRQQKRNYLTMKELYQQNKL